MKKVSKRGGFSDRNGIKPENVEIQLLDMILIKGQGFSYKI